MVTKLRDGSNLAAFGGLLRREPEVSVIVPASENRAGEHLMNALGSVADQTIGQRNIRLFVAAGFDVDLGPFKGWATVVRVPSGPPGPKIAGAIRALNKAGLRSKLTGVLDDDDKYNPHKLEEGCNVFAANPGLCFMVHSFSINAVDGAPPGRVRVVERFMQVVDNEVQQITILDASQKLQQAPWLAGVYFSWNSSRMLFDRTIVRPNVMEWVGYNVDDFVAFEALRAKGRSIALHPEKLSAYTVHNGISTPATTDGYANVMQRWIGGHSKLITAFTGVPEIQAISLSNLHMLEVYRRNAKNRLSMYNTG